jgi:hypothetical protein
MTTTRKYEVNRGDAYLSVCGFAHVDYFYDDVDNGCVYRRSCVEIYASWLLKAWQRYFSAADRTLDSHMCGQTGSPAKRSKFIASVAGTGLLELRKIVLYPYCRHPKTIVIHAIHCRQYCRIYTVI